VRIRAHPCFSPLGFFLLVHHYSAQRLIDSRLVAAPLLLEPGEHVGIDTQRDRLLDWPVPCSNGGAYVVRPLCFTGRRFQPGNLAFQNSHPSFHRCMYITAHINSPVQNVPRGTFCSQPLTQLTWKHVINWPAARKRMWSGDRHGLQNRWAASLMSPVGSTPTRFRHSSRITLGARRFLIG